jgi:uncharacterized OB-fold protein
MKINTLKDLIEDTCKKCNKYFCPKCQECIKCGKENDCHSVKYDLTGFNLWNEKKELI